MTSPHLPLSSPSVLPPTLRAAAPPSSSSSSSSSSAARPQSSIFSQVQVHPLVLMSILDHHIRREASGAKVIGALLGTVSAGGVVEVTNAFGIFHEAKVEEIIVRRQTLNDLLELHRRVDPNETLVGVSFWLGCLRAGWWGGRGRRKAVASRSSAPRTTLLYLGHSEPSGDAEQSLDR